jgi:hypothetical protein
VLLESHSEKIESSEVTLEDDREDHWTILPTEWFIHKEIKIIFLAHGEIE